MRVNDRPEDWTFRIGELEIIDPQTNIEYFLVVGYHGNNLKLILRIFDKNDRLISGNYFDNIFGVKDGDYEYWAYKKEKLSNQCIDLIKETAIQLSKFESFA